MLKVLTLFIFFCTFSSCLIAPLAQSYKEGGFTKSSRFELFQKSVKKFYQDLYWKNYQRAILKFKNSAAKKKFKKFLAKHLNEKIASYSFANINCNDDVTKCTVDAEVTFFTPENPLVKKRREKGVWEYERLSGWQIVNFNFLTN